jgi:thiamine biosynthesis lipoprotein
MATSGNYRNFYYEGEQRRSHTIDPRTGYPVQHSLLSATVVAPTCMQADALATASMVLGADSALVLVQQAGARAYLIVSDPSAPDSLRVLKTPNWNY